MGSIVIGHKYASGISRCCSLRTFLRRWTSAWCAVSDVSSVLACAAAFGLGAVLCYHVCAPVEAPLVQKRPAGDRQGLFDASGQCVASRPAFTA